MARAIGLTLPWGRVSRSDVEPSACMLRGGALCGPSLLERLLRRLLCELLGFLRALHLAPSWSLELTARGTPSIARIRRALPLGTVRGRGDGRSPRHADLPCLRSLVSFGVDKEYEWTA